MELSIQSEIKDEQYAITLEGKLTAVSVKELQAVFDSEISGNENIKEIRINLEKLLYTSSAGLRFFFATQMLMEKRGGNVTVVKPVKAVREVFSDTGFAEMVTIEEDTMYEPVKVDHTVYPLRPIQRWMIDNNFSSLKSTMMNMGGLLQLDLSVDMEALKDSINMVLHEHDIFRCRFLIDKDTGDVKQRFDGEIKEVEIIDKSDEMIMEFIRSLEKPYKLIDRCMYRLYLIRSDSKKYMYINFYHGIMDGYGSVLIFWREMNRYYNAIIQGMELSDIRHGNSSYAKKIREEMDIPEDDKDKAVKYWENMLDGFSEEYLPPRDLFEEPGDNELEFPIAGLHKNDFIDLKYHESPFFMGATLLTMALITGQKKVIMAWIHNGRVTGEDRRLMGLMLVELPIRWEFDKDLSIRDYVQEIDNLMKQGLLYKNGLSKIYEEELDLETPDFIFQRGAIGRRGELSLGDTKAIIVDIEEDDDATDEMSVCDSSIDFELNSLEDGSYSVVFDYNSGRYSEKAIENISGIMKDVIYKMKEGYSLYEILGY
ncbi:MAG: STAS domain-containing protein [Lachnospiraceae bacterium]|nr:STAS domain-containing protein [Lachnospiraceae bacterium]